MIIKQEKNESSHISRLCNEHFTVTHGFNIANKFPSHFHSSYTLGLIEKGETKIYYRGRQHLLHPNDVYIIQPFEIHSCQTEKTTANSYKVISLHLDPERYFPTLLIKSTEFLTMVKEFHKQVFIGEKERSNSIFHEKIKTNLQDYSQLKSKETSLLHPTIISRIKDTKCFIEQHCLKRISLRSIAQHAFLSEFHFSRLFTEYFGLSPYAYYMACKLKAAQKILVGSKSVSVTAYECGFFDQSHFTREFVKHVGVAPGKYLRYNNS